MRLLVILFSVLIFFSCLEDANPIHEREQNETSVWICHNPAKPNHHNKICTESCYEDGNPHRFCWMLDESLCLDDEKTELIRQVCEEVM